MKMQTWKLFLYNPSITMECGDRGICINSSSTRGRDIIYLQLHKIVSEQNVAQCSPIKSDLKKH
jgi:hypothetical protein